MGPLSGMRAVGVLLLGTYIERTSALKRGLDADPAAVAKSANADSSGKASSSSVFSRVTRPTMVSGGLPLQSKGELLTIDTCTAAPGHEEVQGVGPTTKLCQLEDMPYNRTVLVYPGGPTRCLNGDPYAFTVRRGRTDKLLVYFQGLGACWDTFSKVHLTCADSIQVQDHGLAGLTTRQENNSFRDYTTVLVQSCSGDLHAGNTDKYRGYHNTLAVLNWAKSNMDLKLTSFMMMGESAGALGAQLWAHKALRMFQYQEATVVADSFFGIFTPGFAGKTAKAWNYSASLLNWPPALEWRLKDGSITIPDVMSNSIAAFPNVAFASVNSKTDVVQIEFFKMTALSFGRLDCLLSCGRKDVFLNKANGILRMYNKYPNFVSFLLDGDRHVFISEDTPMPHSLLGWLNAFSAQGGKDFRSMCNGEQLLMAQWQGTNYCDARQANKTWTHNNAPVQLSIAGESLSMDSQIAVDFDEQEVDAHGPGTNGGVNALVRESQYYTAKCNGTAVKEWAGSTALAQFILEHSGMLSPYWFEFLEHYVGEAGSAIQHSQSTVPTPAAGPAKGTPGIPAEKTPLQLLGNLFKQTVKKTLMKELNEGLADIFAHGK